MAATVKWGVIGSGGIARRRTIPEGLVPAVNAELVAVYDADDRIAQEMARELQTKSAPDLDSLLADPSIDAVYVATPADLHHRHVLAAAAAGKHVLCEKPLGLTIAEAVEMDQTCSRAGVTLGTAFMMRFLAQHREALRLIQAGRLGRMCYARAQLSCWYPPMAGAWRQVPERGGGGALMDMGGHCIDLLEMLLGPIRSVSCFTSRRVHDYDSEDSSVAMLHFVSGAIGTVDAFFCVPDSSSKNALELYGSRGSILAQGTVGQGDSGRMVAYLDSEDAGYEARQERSAPASGLELSPEPVNTYRAEIEEFSQALLDDRQPTCSAALGLQSQLVLSACYESARTGGAVELAQLQS